MLLVATLLALVLTPRALAYDCPAACDCGVGQGEREYICRQDDTLYQINGLPNRFAKIHCDRTQLNWTAIPFFPFSSNGTLRSLSLSNCELPSSFASVLARLGASDVHSLLMDGAPGVLTAERVKGLRAVQTIMMIDAADQKHIPYDVFDALPLLSDFRIRGARFQVELKLENGGDALPPHRESPAHPALRSVELASSGITDVSRGAVSKLRYIKKLYLWSNKIENFTSDSFTGLEALDTLALSGNPITALPSRAFAAAPRLRSLTLDSMSLGDVPSDAFEGLPELENILFIFGRASIKFSPRALAALSALKTLTFQRTPLDPLPGDLLDGSTAIEELTIKGAGLETLPQGLFRSQQRTKKLDLSRNNIKALEPDIFWPLKALQELNLDDNNIEEFPEQFFAGLANLTFLTANNNRLKFIADDAFRGANFLEFLSLNHNLLTLKPRKSPNSGYFNVLDQSPLKTLVNLKELHLQRNQISEWTPVQVYNLQKLDLSRNNFTYLMIADIQFLANDLVIDLRHNYITTIEVSETTNWPKDEFPKKTNTTMLLDDNPFKCDCELHMLIRRLHGSKPLSAEPKIDVGNARCASPPDFAGRLVQDIPESSLTCSLRPQDYFTVAVGLLLGLLVAYVAVLIYRYILEIKVFLFSRGWCQCLIKEDELDKDAQYDAFVMFSEKDARWVSGHLLPKLEGAPNNFKLCVHYRDWVLGDTIPAQIARSVEQSRRTIVVLSKNFLKSTWAQLEFTAANVRAQRERRARVLVIVLEDVVNCEKMDDELRAYLSTNTYLKWGDRWFWEKLIFAMPHKKTGHLNEVYY